MSKTPVAKIGLCLGALALIGGILVPSASARRLNGDLVDASPLDTDVLDFTLSPNGHFVIYRAEQTAHGTQDLWAVNRIGTPRPIRLDTTPTNGGVREHYTVTFNSRTVVYIADQDTDGVDELYAVPIGGGSPTKLNEPLECCGSVASFALAPNGEHVVYRSRPDPDSPFQIYSVRIDGTGSVPAFPV